MNTGRITLADGPALAGHRVQLNAQQHLLVIDNAIVPCTPTEYALLLHLLQHLEESLPTATLLTVLGQAPGDEAARPGVQSAVKPSQRQGRQARRVLTQHMSRLRAKLWPLGFDILCLTGYGYLLHATPPAPE